MNLKFHHVGILCENLESSCALYKKLGFLAEGETYVDKTQGIQGAFFSEGELSDRTSSALGSEESRGEPASERASIASPRIPVFDLDEAFKEIRALGAMPLGRPVSAVVFRRVCFFQLPDRTVIELVEAKEQF